MTRDLRRYTSQTNIRLLIGGLILLFLIGDGLIYFFYGQSAALFGFLCLLAGLAPLLFIWIMLTLLGWIANKADR
jgi:hypothetical protein